MNYRLMGRLFAWILLLEAVFMLPALLLCAVDGDTDGTTAFLYSIAIAMALFALLYPLTRGSLRRGGFYAKEGLVTVGVSWILMCLVGCLPFFFSRQIPYFIDALFEIVSGFTTTGSSILPNVEALSRGLLYWRSFSHWVGGMGVLVFLLAVVPVGENRGFTMHLLRAESPGPEVGKLVPKMRSTAAFLYGSYLVLSLINFVFLLAGGMPWFDALCTMFGTAGTGGFGIRADSMASYSPYLQNVTTVFMFLFGINFSCYYLVLIKNIRGVLMDEELRLYAAIVLGATLLITFNTLDMYSGLWEALRHAVFQVSSIITTTGYATVNFDLWPTFSKVVLLCLMVIGACAGSTGGGLKCARVLILGKSFVRDLKKTMNPGKVELVRVNRRPLDERLVAATGSYLITYILILFVSLLLVSLDPASNSVATSLSAVFTCLNNVGPGLDLVGPVGNFASFQVFTKCVLIFDMLAGRLELFPILVLFSSGAWKRA